MELSDVLRVLGAEVPPALAAGGGGRALAERLAAAGAVPPKTLQLATEMLWGTAPLPAEPAAVARVPENLARRYQVCPVCEVPGGLVLVCAAIPGPRTQQELRLAVGQDLRFVEVAPSRLQEALELHYRSQVVWAGGGDRGQDTGAAALVDEIIARAVRMGASDIHIAPTDAHLTVRFRVDGVLYPAPPLPVRLAAGVLARIKVMAGLDIVETHRPQDGRLTAAGGVEVRVSTIGTIHGEKAVLRLLTRSGVQTLDSLGLLSQQLQVWRQAVAAPHGLVLVAGPTGSGKTTTLYASLREMDRTTRNVVSLEDPVESPIEGVSQVPVSSQNGVDFASGLRALMRQDPDVILVGEIRDPETASTAVQAALTGHLVLATLHATTAPGAIYRLLDLGMPAYLLAGALTHVLTQRLVRRVCGHCRGEKPPVPMEAAYWKAWMQGPPPEKMAAGGGCPACHGTGYAGRMVVAEILRLSEDLRRLIAAGTPPSTLAAQVAQEGFVPMQRAGCLAARGGLTTLAEVIRHVG